MKELNIQNHLSSKKVNKPGIMYSILGGIWKAFVYPKYKCKINYKVDTKKIKGPFIMVSNHTSRNDYIFTGVASLKQKMNFVAGYNEFYRSHLKGVFDLLQVIPKRNFTPDFVTMKNIKRILDKGGSISIYPEGMNSISGENQPVAIGTGKFLKHFKVPVYYTFIQGGYLTGPKYNLNDRMGPIEVEIGKAFDIEELDKLSNEEIEDKLNHLLYHDAYEWNKTRNYHYGRNSDGIADGLETLLFYCPKCHKQFTMKSESDKFYCTNCNNGVTIDNTYKMTPFDENCVIPETQTKWFRLQRRVIQEEVKEESFKLESKVKLGMLPKDHYLKNYKTSEIVGEGILSLDKTGLTYNGTKDNEDYSFHIDSKLLPSYGMCTDITRFYTFVDLEFVEFYPETNCVEKFIIATEEIHRLNGGKWKGIDYDNFEREV